MDDLKYLEDHPFKYADEHMDVVMEVCPMCQALQSPHVKVRVDFACDPTEPARQEYHTVDHGLHGLLCLACKLAENNQAGVWDFIYSMAAWRMMLPGVQALPTPPKSRAH